MAAIPTCGRIIAELSPVAGHTAACTYDQSYSVCLIARGRVPLRDQPCVSAPCWFRGEAKPRFVLEPDLDDPAAVVATERVRRRGADFLNASCAARSALRWIGRGRNGAKPSRCSTAYAPESEKRLPKYSLILSASTGRAAPPRRREPDPARARASRPARAPHRA